MNSFSSSIPPFARQNSKTQKRRGYAKSQLPVMKYHHQLVDYVMAEDKVDGGRGFDSVVRLEL
jgi:hypothetical protein